MEQYVTIYDQFTIKRVIRKLSKQVSDIIEKKGAENCVLITVLNGGAYLSHKIIDNLGADMRCELTTDVVKVSSYDKSTQVEMKREYIPKVDYEGKTVIVIDDFCDSGKTLNYLLLEFGHKAAEVIFVTLLARKRRKVFTDLKLLYGIEDSTNNFYYGCGLDEDGKGRYMDCIMTKINTDK